MREKYYWAEHRSVYAQIAREGKDQWDALFEAADFDAFTNRAFLEEALSRIDLQVGAEVFEYGCGTGPAACLLAALGYRVHAVDLIPEAIELARRNAQERNLHVDFAVQDVCALADVPAERQYAMVMERYCLQSIVTDEDRARLFAAVRARVEPGGHYVLSTAMYDPERRYDGEFVFDPATGICQRNGVPYRRHLTASALRAELSEAGFTVVSQTGRLGGDLVCRPRS
jgi:2-polyprenyl-3-methyl-5-hydroxy-6-metoxy-1,4-benzoquinol methylase